MNSKFGGTIFYLVCAILGALFLMSVVTSISRPPSSFTSWMILFVKAFGLYCVYDVIRFKNIDSASYLRFVGLLVGGSSLIQIAIIASSLGKVMEANEGIEPFNKIVWMTVTVAATVGGIYCLCGAAFWLPAVKRFLASHQSEDFEDDFFDSEVDEFGVSIEPYFSGSVKEFMAFIEKEEPGPTLEKAGYFLYIKIPESLLPDERHKKYAEPIHDFLEAGNFGFTDGGGTMIGAEKHIEYIGIEAVVHEREVGVEAVIRILRQLDAPRGTQIHVEDEIVDVW